MQRKKRKAKIIGRRDKIDLPDLSLWDLDAKIDTGAYTSALHVKGIKPIEKVDGLWVAFKLKHPTHPSYNNMKFELPVYAHKHIKNSFGQIEKRYIIRTPLVIFGKSYITEFSLTNRSKMECPVLLGRKLLYRKFMVNVSQKNLSYQQKQKTLSPDS